MCCIMVLYANNVHPANSRSTWSWRIQLSSHSANKHAAGEANKPCLSCIITPDQPPPFTEWQVLLILPLNRRHIWSTQITKIVSQTLRFQFWVQISVLRNYIFNRYNYIVPEEPLKNTQHSQRQRKSRFSDTSLMFFFSVTGSETCLDIWLHYVKSYIVCPQRHFYIQTFLLGAVICILLDECPLWKTCCLTEQCCGSTSVRAK